MRALICPSIITLLLFLSTDLTAQVSLLAENFNAAGTPAGWVKTNSSSGGNIAASDWTLRPDGYVYSSFVGPETFHSNDNSQFYLSNSEDQGGVTETTLRSAPFSTVGYPFLTLNFYHYFWQYTANDSGFVEVSTDNSTWTRVTAFTYPEETRDGASDGFVQKTVNLNAFSGQPVLYVRFRYYAEFGWYWAIDNVSVTGSSTGVCVNNSWEGTVSTEWEQPANWSCGSIPTANSLVMINAGKPRYPVINSNAVCKSLTTATGATVQVATGHRLDILGP